MYLYQGDVKSSGRCRGIIINSLPCFLQQQNTLLLNSLPFQTPFFSICLKRDNLTEYFSTLLLKEIKAVFIDPCHEYAPKKGNGISNNFVKTNKRNMLVVSREN